MKNLFAFTSLILVLSVAGLRADEFIELSGILTATFNPKSQENVYTLEREEGDSVRLIISGSIREKTKTLVGRTVTCTGRADHKQTTMQAKQIREGGPTPMEVKTLTATLRMGKNRHLYLEKDGRQWLLRHERTRDPAMYEQLRALVDQEVALKGEERQYPHQPWEVVKIESVKALGN